MNKNNGQKGFFRKATENFKDFEEKKDKDMARYYFNKLLKPYIQNLALKNLKTKPGITMSGGVGPDLTTMKFVLNSLNTVKNKKELKLLLELLDEDETKIKTDLLGKLAKDTFGENEIKDIIDKCKEWLTIKIKKIKKLSKDKLDLVTKQPEKVEVNHHMGKKEVLGYSKIRGAFNCLGWALQQITGSLNVVRPYVDLDQDCNAAARKVRDNLCSYLKSIPGVNVVEVEKDDVSNFKTKVQDRLKDNILLAIRVGNKKYQTEGKWKLNAGDCHFMKYEKTSKGHAVWTEKAGAQELYMLNEEVNTPDDDEAWVIVHSDPSGPDLPATNYMFNVHSLIASFKVNNVSNYDSPGAINSNSFQTGDVITFDGPNLKCVVMGEDSHELEFYLSKKNLEITGIERVITNDHSSPVPLVGDNARDVTAHDFSKDKNVINAILGCKPGGNGFTCGEVAFEKPSHPEPCIKAKNLSIIFNAVDLGLDLHVKAAPYISKTLYLYVETDITKNDNSTRARAKSTG